MVEASILEPGESKLFLERAQNKLTPLILGSKECRMKGRGSEGWERVSRVKEEQLRRRVKIKGGEFIFALIATELRNCLTGKIAPAQANYIHLLDLLPPLLFLPPPSSTPFSHSKLFSLSLSLYSSEPLSDSSTLFPYFPSLTSLHPSRRRLALLCPASDHLYLTPLWRSVFLSNKIQLGRELKRANCGQLVASLVKPSTTFQPSSYC